MTLWKRSWDTAKWTELDCQAARETVEAYEHAHEVGARGASTEANKQIDRLKQAIINYESEQKLALVDCLFAVSAVDQSILTVEDNEVRRVANELKLEHADYIAVRARHVPHLAVMQDTDKGPPRGRG